MILPESTTELLDMDIKELWNCYQTLMEEETEEGTKLKQHYTEETAQITNGINIQIPIYYLTNEWYETYPTSKKVKVLGHGKYKINDFMQEKQDRENLLRQVISEQIETGPTTIPRT